MLDSYAPWAVASEGVDVFLQRARLLRNIDQAVRRNTGFQPGWKISQGANVSSPLFESFHEREIAAAGAAMVQTSTVLPPHPKLPGKTVTRLALTFTMTHEGAALGQVMGHRRGDAKSATPIRISIPKALVAQMTQSIGTMSSNVFMATLAFEVMADGQEHELPFYGLPTVGPYRDFSAANSLSIRVEWKHGSESKWFSAPLQIGSRRHRKIGIALLKGDGSQMERLYQEAMALLQMIRGEECPDAPPGFWRSLGARGSRAMVQRLEVDHLGQSIRWVAQLPIQAAPPTRASVQENTKLLYDNRGPQTTVGFQPPKGTAYWYRDNTSSKSAGKKVACDTCMIISRCRASGDIKFGGKCTYDPVAKACPACKALKRQCTFTPITKLLSSWVGKEIDTAEYTATAGMVLFPPYGAGPARKLISHLAMEKGVHVVTEIPEPPGWESLFPWLDSGEGTADGMTQDAVLGDREDGDEDGDSD